LLQWGPNARASFTRPLQEIHHFVIAINGDDFGMPFGKLKGLWHDNELSFVLELGVVYEVRSVACLPNEATSFFIPVLTH
tara:strand:+ start:320 stop:559 length:240 start_codon:yes stop_codon:yes gene_type:complete